MPGVRENGGQYTHAAIWAAMAFAALGDSERAWELFDMINPVQPRRHADGDRDATRSSPTWSPPTSTRVAPHTGRGGWTWYTGSAGWMYRLIIESLLGLRRRASSSGSSPKLPDSWDTLQIDYRFGEALYRIALSC